jgi:hypothetical protein
MVSRPPTRDAARAKGDRILNKGVLVGSLVFLVASFYLFILAARPGETVQLIPGHDVTDRLAVMLGAIGLLGAAVVGAESLRRTKEAEKETPKHDIPRRKSP